MKIKAGNVFLFSTLLVLCHPVLASYAAAEFPERPITLFCMHTPGSASDLSLRALAASAANMLGQPVIVENRAGGGGVPHMILLAKAKPDGYTLGTTSDGSLGTRIHVIDLPFDPLKDFDHIMAYGKWVYGPLVRADSPFKTLKDLVSYAKANPRKIKYGVSGLASPNNYFMIYLAKQEGIQWDVVVFKGIVEAATSLLGGHIDVVASTGNVGTPYVQSGRCRLLASASERWKWVPDVPTFKELGYNFEIDSYFGLSAPKGVPKPILKRLRDVFKIGLNDPEFLKLMERTYVPISYLDSDQYQALILKTYKQSEAMMLDIGMHKSQKKK